MPCESGDGRVRRGRLAEALGAGEGEADVGDVAIVGWDEEGEKPVWRLLDVAVDAEAAEEEEPERVCGGGSGWRSGLEEDGDDGEAAAAADGVDRAEPEAERREAGPP